MLGTHLSEWLSLGLRWLHVVAGVVWIGTSFYFIWLNNHVRRSPDQLPGSDAELWAVHGGGFYRVLKYERPPQLPDTLHWFKWEAYTTWWSGFALLVLIFYVDAPLFLIDPTRANLTTLTASALGLATLVLGWLVYDRMSHSRLLDDPPFFAAVSLVLVTGVALGLSQLFSSRGAYVHVGALLGTLMAGNVFFVIIPAQRELVAAMEQGRDPDMSLGEHAAVRSLHNNYMTLPVLFIMVSSHFPFTFGYDQGWAILAGLIVIGAAIRHWFNLRGQGRRNAWIMPAAAAGMLALAFVTLPRSNLPEVDPSTVGFDDGVAIVQARCVTCHSVTPTQAGFTAPPKDITFDSPDAMVAQAALIRAMAVDTKTMPLGNLTQMTLAERAVLKTWLDQYTDG
jgi:uncharacterized membrane protein